MGQIPDKLRQLLNKPEWTIQERRWLLEYLESSPGEELRQLLEQKFRENIARSSRRESSIEDSKGHEAPVQYAPGEAEVLHRIHAGRNMDAAGKGRLLPLWTRWVAAASVLFILSLAGYRYSHRSPSHSAPAAVAAVRPPAATAVPADKPTLTLADGSTVVLDEAKDGQLTRQGAVPVIKMNGRLSYGPASAADEPVSYNTLTTPRGRQFQLELPDGSLVFLNAASSIRFPTRFSGTQRRVAITGEAYFEIAKNASRPFWVEFRGSEVQVLGTSFNISAYEDEPLMKTTLLEGSVRFLAPASTIPGAEANTALLRPGQQAQLDGNGKIKTLTRVDINEVMAWKKGLFHFDGENIRFVMKELSRWYDIEVVYGKEEGVEHFSADIPRSTSLADVLKVLQLTRKIRFRIEGKKVFVLE